MARIRTIKPELPQSESMGRVSREARLCFILLWTLADDAGRLRGNSRMLASLLYPYDDDAKKHIDKWLADLHEQGCITRYAHEGDQYIQINAWLTHQKIDKPSPSKIPPPPEDSRGFARIREDSAADQGEDQGEEGNVGDARAPQEPEGFVRFWTLWPSGGRKGARNKCLELWCKKRLEPESTAILSHVTSLKATDGWREQNGKFIPAPLVYLNGARWDGADVGGMARADDDVFAGAL